MARRMGRIGVDNRHGAVTGVVAERERLVLGALNRGADMDMNMDMDESWWVAKAGLWCFTLEIDMSGIID